MPFHVHMFLYDDERRSRGRPIDYFNLDEDSLRERVIRAWDRGTAVIWAGRTAQTRLASIKIVQTDDVVEEGVSFLEVSAAGEDVTNQWITRPAGAASADAHAPEAKDIGVPRDPKRVMVVHGRNLRARDAIFTFLRALGLQPIEWDEAIHETGSGSPHNLDAVRAAMRVGQAVVVVMTAEDQAGLLPDLSDDDDDRLLRGQPRQNVILEAGMAWATDPTRTILVELGDIRRPSDFEGLNVVRLNDTPMRRTGLRTRLETAGCAVQVPQGSSDWQRPDAGGNFDEAAVAWRAQEPPPGSGP